MLGWVLLITAIAGVVGTGIGGLVSSLFRKDSNKTVSLLLSFAGGVMLSVVYLDLIMESIETPNVGLFTVALWIAVGFCVVALLNYIIDRSTNHEVPHIDKEHPRTADDLDELIHSDHYLAHEKNRSDLFVAGIIMAAAIALHNLPEGMVIGAAYVGTTDAAVWTGSGIIMALVIGLHNIPEGMAVTVPLVAGGMKKWKAVLITAASGFPTVIGAFAGYTLGTLGDVWHVVSLGFASGAMMYVVFGELLPESILIWRSKIPAFAVLVGVLCGMLIIFG